MKSCTTLRDLSRMANVSVNTISRALNDRNGVNPQTKARILNLAELHNYRPNLMARGMRIAQSRLIGTIVGDISDPFFVQLLSGIEEEASREQMPIIIGNTAEDAYKQQTNLELLLSYGCRNIVITPVDTGLAFLDTLREVDAQCVIADRVPIDAPDCDCVAINIRRDSARATEYLIQCGHRRIALLNQRSDLRTETDRTAGYLDAMRERGLPVNDLWVAHCTGRESAGRSMRRILDLPEAERPTAVFIAKDTLALDAVTAVYDSGLHIPDDLSVVLYGSPEWSQRLRPYFTCMVRAVSDIGRISARILIAKMRGEKTAAPVSILFDSSLVVRDSVRMI
ncbi:LacI family transcriptional regulator [Clostridia bacterium]|nr:LacI family transcriptional regulator [Clostridia bacterium]